MDYSQEKRGANWRSCMKNTSKRQIVPSQSNTKTLQQRLITQRLRPDLGRSVEVTTVIQPVLLT